MNAATIIEVRFPADQQEGTEATVARWLVTEGDRVAAHDPVVEVETDKVVVEIAAPATGRIAEIKIQQDEKVNPGDVLCTLNTDMETASEPGAIKEPNAPAGDTGAPPGRDRLSPAVRQLVAQHNLNITDLTGSGSGGRVTRQDVEALITSQKPLPPAPAKRPVPDSTPAPPSETTEVIPHNKMRKRIADNMVASLMHTAPHVTAVFEADLTAIMQHRSQNKEEFARAGTPLTLTVYFIAAAVAAIQKVPAVNSRWFDDHLEIYHHINIGIGTALGEEGLIVPVLHNVQHMDLQGIAANLSELTMRARDNRLKPGDVHGGTFTISNHGVSGSLIATPIIINQPQSAILGVGKIEKRIKIMEIEGEDVIAIRPMCYVTLTIDHRVLDGYQTNAFLSSLVGRLENWS